MGKNNKDKKAASAAGVKEDNTANGGGKVVGVITTTDTDAEAAAKKEERRLHTQRMRDAQAQTARIFKQLAAGLDDAMKAGLDFSAAGRVFANNDAVYEVINAGDTAVATGFPTLDRPRLSASRGKGIDELKAERSKVLDKIVAREISYDEGSTLIAAIENKIRRLQTAADKKAVAEKAASEQQPGATA